MIRGMGNDEKLIITVGLIVCGVCLVGIISALNLVRQAMNSSPTEEESTSPRKIV